MRGGQGCAGFLREQVLILGREDSEVKGSECPPNGWFGQRDYRLLQELVAILWFRSLQSRETDSCVLARAHARVCVLLRYI